MYKQRFLVCARFGSGLYKFIPFIRLCMHGDASDFCLLLVLCCVCLGGLFSSFVVCLPCVCVFFSFFSFRSLCARCTDCTTPFLAISVTYLGLVRLRCLLVCRRPIYPTGRDTLSILCGRSAGFIPSRMGFDAVAQRVCVCPIYAFVISPGNCSVGCHASMHVEPISIWDPRVCVCVPEVVTPIV